MYDLSTKLLLRYQNHLNNLVHLFFKSCYFLYIYTVNDAYILENSTHKKQEKYHWTKAKLFEIDIKILKYY